jgi:hypothetical protein
MGRLTAPETTCAERPAAQRLQKRSKRLQSGSYRSRAAFLCRPGAGRDPRLLWIPAFAGMTRTRGYDTIRLILSPGAGTGGVRQRLAIAAHDGSANCGKRLAGTGSARFTPFYQG